MGARCGEEGEESVCLLGWGCITYSKADENDNIDDEGEGITRGW